MADSLCRWGILGTANIARKNWQSIRNSGNGRLVAVASRTRERAQQFIDECGSEVAFSPAPRPTSYDELLASPEIDAVYIPLPTGIRKEWVLKAAKAGKHVLCEKPCGSTAAEVAEMLEACRAANVQFMDGVMFMHSARLPAMRATLDDGRSVGQLKRIASQFSFLAPEEFLQGNIRVSHQLEPLGCLGDLGWYNVRFTLWAMNYAMPERVVGRMLAETRPGSGDSVPLEFSGELLFAGGVSASFYCSFLTENQQWANLSGTRGNLQVDDFVLPFFGGQATYTVRNPAFDMQGTQFNMREVAHRHRIDEYSNNQPNSQETNLFRNFAKLALSGKPNPHWPKIALQTQQVLEACLESARRGGEVVGMSKQQTVQSEQS
jgi:predicted dehydrogenase